MSNLRNTPNWNLTYKYSKEITSLYMVMRRWAKRQDYLQHMVGGARKNIKVRRRMAAVFNCMVGDN